MATDESTRGINAKNCTAESRDDDASYNACTRCDCNALIRKCVTSATPATSILAFMTSNSISLAIRMSPPGLRGRHLLVFDLCRFIYLYVYYADFGATAAAAAAAAAAAGAAAADGKCA